MDFNIGSSVSFPAPCASLHHRSLKILRAHDGKIDVSLYVEVSRSLVQWILGFYDRVEVLEPECLRTELKNFSGWLADTYKK